MSLSILLLVYSFLLTGIPLKTLLYVTDQFCEFYIFVYLHKPNLSSDHVARLIARQLARLQSIDMSAAAAEFGDNVRIDTEPSLFKSLYGWLEYCPFSSTDPQHQARYPPD